MCSTRESTNVHHPLSLRLDFDRAGLDVTDQVGLTLEAARQLVDQLGTSGHGLVDARLEAGSFVEPSNAVRKTSLRQTLPQTLATMLGAAVSAAQRPVLVVLDTLEVLRGRGETHPDTLFKWLDSLVLNGVRPMYVLAGGRGDALDSLPRIDDNERHGAPPDNRPARVKRLLTVPGLEDAAARALLTRLEAPPKLHGELLELAQGNPLKLRLAAEVAKRSGVGNLRRKRKQEVSAAFLYRMLLSRIDDPVLRKLAHPGLIVRRINAELIRKVLAPTLGLGTITEARADALLDDLSTHYWLVEQDAGAPGFLKHRSDMRMLLLPLLYQSSPKRSARVDTAALRWFAALPQDWAQVEAVYHELQLTRVGRSPPSVASRIAAQFDAQTLDELPRAAADLVRLTRGERSSQFRADAPQMPAPAADTGFERELLSIMQRQDWREGAFIVRGITDAGGLDVYSRGADAIRAFLWRSGQWAQARRWLIERDRFNDSDEDLDDLPPAFALARLEMRAEFDPDGLRRRLPALRVKAERWLVDAALSAPDNCARHGALALLLNGLPDPLRFPWKDGRDNALAAAADEQWIHGGGPEANLALELGRQQLRATELDPERFDRYPAGETLATLTPYSAFAVNLTVINEFPGLQDMAQRFAKSFEKRDTSDGERGPALVAPSSRDPIVWLTRLSLFAEWAEALGFVRRDEDLRLIGRSAERWRRTMAGDWSIGRRRGAWAQRPPLDETLQSRLFGLLSGRDPIGNAQEQLDCLTAPDEAPVSAQIRRRLRHALSEAPANRSTPEDILIRLLKRGVPAAFAPALAVSIALVNF